MTLYEMTEQFKELLLMMDEGEIDEDVLADTLEGLTGEIDEKIDGLCAVIKTLAAEANAITTEAVKLADRAKVKAKRCEKLEGYLSDMLQKIGRDKFENPRHTVRFNKGEKVVFTDEAAMMAYLKKHYPDLVKTKVETKPDKNGIKKALKDGIEIPFADTEITMSISVK